MSNLIKIDNAEVFKQKLVDAVNEGMYNDKDIDGNNIEVADKKFIIQKIISLIDKYLINAE